MSMKEWFNLLELTRVSQTSLDMQPSLQEWLLLTVGHMNLKTLGRYDRNIFQINLLHKFWSNIITMKRL
jgi:hypothetical protein